ncbi:MAG: hypothetical protein ACJAX4_000649, partial [Clostridium sp.]
FSTKKGTEFSVPNRQKYLTINAMKITFSLHK